LWLLKDISHWFTKTAHSRVFSDELLAHLTALEESPWGEWRQGRPLSKNQLARLLKPFGIHSRPVRRQKSVKRGYQQSDFEEAFRRYLPASHSPGAVSSVTTLQTSAGAASAENQNVTENHDVTLSDIPILNAGAGCNVVAVGESSDEDET